MKLKIITSFHSFELELTLQKQTKRNDKNKNSIKTIKDIKF